MADAVAVADRDNDPLPHTPIGVDRDDSPSGPFHEDQQQQQQQQHRRRGPVLSRTVSNSSRPREATELDEIISPSTPSTASISSDEYRSTPRQSVHEARSIAASSASSTTKQHFQALRRFWARHVTLNVPQKGNRDYFALERTFLAYMRTAATFSMQGVLVAQIFRLRSQSQSSNHPAHLSFHSVGVPISVAYQVCAILVALVGAYRFWRQQNAIARGKIVSGGWEVNCVGYISAARNSDCDYC
ncbi:hypothetical protein UA08_06073 [Talaromyces atroroseus]|uniref:DUF202 domain-containing protein n=1 Tax=Talaromyces atroroseus TaxID=1441469 RepID=A0A225AVC2_TALAT|nr:hypothetical protein UA08_06073 [Talaromyces atroroseus]OKL58385.1 hypothetical protein UA08_06073 [Talaromyces atroroseus]